MFKWFENWMHKKYCCVCNKNREIVKLGTRLLVVENLPSGIEKSIIEAVKQADEADTKEILKDNPKTMYPLVIENLEEMAHNNKKMAEFERAIEENPNLNETKKEELRKFKQ